MEAYDDVLKYVSDYWPQLIRNNPPAAVDDGTLIGLPRPYLIPSQREFAEMYYWDSYFMCIGLVDTEHEGLVLDVVENCAYLIDRLGFIPNASRYYYTSRSQPPFFTALMRLGYNIKEKRGDSDLLEYLERMRKLAAREHEVAWLGQEHRHERLVHRGLSRYRDVNANDFNASCESGWDHSTRCDGRNPNRDSGRWLSFLPVCLNSILYAREKDLQWAADILGDRHDADRWREKAEARAATMHELMWNEEFKFYYDYQYQGERTQIDVHETLAGFYPMWAGLATRPQAQNMVRHWLPKFLFPGGLATSLPDPASPPSNRQWAFPNGWAPLQWIVVSGLERYGFTHEAHVVRRWWCDNCAYVFRNGTGADGFGRGMLIEKYGVAYVGQLPVPGLYGTGVGFGWSNAVFVDFARSLVVARTAT
jgi:alpha,alpha-trehalase